MLAAHGFYQESNLFFLLLRAFVTRRLSGVDTLEEVEEAFACLGAINDGDRFEQNAPFDGFRFEVVPFFEMKLFAQLSRQGNLRGAFDAYQRHS
jgi:hypothetical protein